MNWADSIDRWTDHMIAAGARVTTIATRRYQIGRLARDHARRAPWSLTAQDLVTWTSRKPWATETRRSYRAALRSFYRWAEGAGHIERSPAESLPTIRPQRTAPRPAPDDVVEAALAAADDRVRLILSLAAYGGLRRAEISGLRWDHISDTAIRVIGKGGHVRVVPIHPQLRRLLTAERARRVAGQSGTGYRYRAGLDEYLFPGMDGGPMTPPALGKIAARALAGSWTVHTLRHRFGTRAYALGGRDLLAVQELLGHASPDTTRRYTQTPDGALLDAVNAI